MLYTNLVFQSLALCHKMVSLVELLEACRKSFPVIFLFLAGVRFRILASSRSEILAFMSELRRTLLHLQPALLFGLHCKGSQRSRV